MKVVGQTDSTTRSDWDAHEPGIHDMRSVCDQCHPRPQGTAGLGATDSGTEIHRLDNELNGSQDFYSLTA